MEIFYGLNRENNTHIKDIAIYSDEKLVVLTKTHIILIFAQASELSIDIGRLISNKYKDLYNFNKICVNHNKIYLKN